MLESGVILLFLTPGIAVYAALYGLFHSGKSIAPEPPTANSLEAVTVILAGALAVHLATMLLQALNGWVCDTLGCPVNVPRALLQPYHYALDAVEHPAANGRHVFALLVITAVQGIASYALVRKWLEWLVRRDRLPHWIYGWATPIANAADNTDTAIIAYVLTTTDVGAKAVAYGGLLHDMALKSDGSVSRISLLECDRYIVDLASPDDPEGADEPLSQFPLMIIDAENIRNISFDTVDLAAIERQAGIVTPRPAVP